MLILTRAEASGDLRLTAYTFDALEFRDLERTLDRAGIRPRGKDVPKDQNGRDGRVYKVPSRFIIALGSLLYGSFFRDGQFAQTHRGPNQFACEETGLQGIGQRCETISADDLAAARVVCALLARAKGWFGGVPRPGT